MASLNPLQGTLGTRRAAHLLRRASFRYNKSRVDALAGMNPTDAVASLLVKAPLQMTQPVYDDPDSDPVENIEWLIPEGQDFPGQDPLLRRYVAGWWLNEALWDPGIGHRMGLFYHQYMATSMTASNHATYFDYLRLLDWGSLGNFKKLATKMVTDNVMLRYLNNNENTKNNPNENFAREFFELFTIGKGPQLGPGDYTNYTEDDIVEAAKVFTGFRSRPDRGVIDPETGIPTGFILVNQHDTGSKSFSSKFQNTVIQGGTNGPGIYQELLDLVDMVFAQDETAKLLCRRLYHFFVSRILTDEIETDIIEPLADTLRSNDYEIVPVLQQLLQSEHFYDEDDSDNQDEIFGGLIRSPLDLFLQSIHLFELQDQVPSPTLNPGLHYGRFYNQVVFNHILQQSGMPLFLPTDVAGYPGYYQQPDYNRQFFNSSTIIPRYKLPAMLLSGRRVIGQAPNATIIVQLDVAAWVRDSDFFSNALDSSVLVEELLRYTLPEEATNERFNYYLITVFLDNLPPADWTYEWQNYLDTGDDTEVKIPLERLINAIMYSPEYQTM